MQLNAYEVLLYAIAEYCSSRLDDYVLVNKIRGDEIQRSILTKKIKKNVFQYVVIFIFVTSYFFLSKKKFDSNNYVILQYEFV